MRKTLKDEKSKEKFEGGDWKTSRRLSRMLWIGWTRISLQMKEWAANSKLQGEEILAQADTKKLEECKAEFKLLTKFMKEVLVDKTEGHCQCTIVRFAMHVDYLRVADLRTWIEGLCRAG